MNKKADDSRLFSLRRPEFSAKALILLILQLSCDAGALAFAEAGIQARGSRVNQDCIYPAQISEPAPANLVLRKVSISWGGEKTGLIFNLVTKAKWN